MSGDKSHTLSTSELMAKALEVTQEAIGIAAKNGDSRALTDAAKALCLIAKTHLEEARRLVSPTTPEDWKQLEPQERLARIGFAEKQLAELKEATLSEIAQTRRLS